MIDGLVADTNFWVMLSTVLCFAFIAVKGRHAVAAALAARTVAVKQRLDEAEALRLEAQALLNEAREKSEKAMDEAKQIVENAQRRADQMRQQMEQDTRDMIAREELKAKSRIARMEEETVKLVKEQIIGGALQQVKTSVANDAKIKPSLSASLSSIQSVLKK